MSTVATLAVKIVANISDFEKTLASTEKSLSKTGASLQSMGSKLTTGLTLPLVGAATAAIKFSSDFESSITKLVTLSGISESQLGKMRSAILDLAPTVGIGPKALADAMVVVTSTGFQGAEAIDILTIAAKSSAIGMGDSKDVARALTSVISAYGAENITAAQAGDILFATVVQGGAEATELAGTLGTVIGIAAQLGVSFQETGAFIATYTRLGVSAEEATTGLRGVLTTILNPSAEAAKALGAIGMSANSLRAAVAQNGLGETLISLLAKLKASGGADAIGAVFGNVRALAAVLGTAGSQLEGYRANLDAIKNSAGGLNKAFEVWGGTTAATWAKFSAGAQAALIAIGDQLAPAFSRMLTAAMPLFGVVVKLATWFSQLPSSVQTGTIAFLALAAAIGPITYVVGTVISTFGALTGVLAPITAVVGGLVVTFGGWAVLLGGAVVAAVIALGVKTGFLQGAFTLLYDVLKITVGAVEAIWGWVSNLSIWTDMAEAVSAVGTAFASMIPEWVKNGVAWIANKFKEAAQYAHLLADALGGNGAAPPPPGHPSMFQPGTVPAIVAPHDAVAAGAAQAEAATKAAADAAKKWREELDKLNGTEAIHVAHKWMQQIDQIGGITRLAAKDQKAYNEALGEAIDAMGRAGKSIDPKMMQAFLNSFQGPEIHKGVTVTGFDGDVNRPTGLPGKPVDQPVAPYVPLPNIPITSGLPMLPGGQMPGVNIGLPQIPKMSLFETFFGTSQEFGAKLSSTVMNALQGGGNIGKAVGGMLGTELLGGLAAKLTQGAGAMFKGLFGGILSSILPGLGGILGSLLGSLVGKIGGLFNHSGRSAVEDFAAGQGGFDALHANLLKLGDEGERMWIKLTQGTKRGDAKGAGETIAEIQAALGNGPPDPMGDAASAAGFHTIAEQQATAQQAVQLWQYMRDAGTYSAEAVQKAWEAANQALIGSGNEQAIAAQAAQQAITDLDGKIQGLQQSIANEAPEEVMGVVEAQTRAQIKGLEDQRAAQQTNLDAMTAAFQAFVDQINGTTIHVSTVLDAPTGAPGGVHHDPGTTEPTTDPSQGAVPGFATGGIIRARRGGTIINVGEGGRDEAIVPLSGSGGSMGGSRLTSTFIMEVEGRAMAEITVPHIPGVVQRFGLA